MTLRFPPIAPTDYDEDQARMAGKAMPTGPFDVFMRAPCLWEALQEVRRYLSDASSLPLPLREMLMLEIARHWRSDSALAAHVTMAGKAGLAPEVVARIVAGEPLDASIDPGHQAALDLARSLLATTRAPDPVFTACRVALGARATVEIVGLIGFFSTVCLTLNLGEIGPAAPAAKA